MSFSAFWGGWTPDITFQNSSSLQIGRNCIQNQNNLVNTESLMEISGVLLYLWRQFEVQN